MNLTVIRPVIENCEGCGACCAEQPVPPFLDEIDLIPAALQAELKAHALTLEGNTNPPGPCTWLEPRTLRCRHYEHRPNLCREFELGGDCCQETRSRRGIR